MSAKPNFPSKAPKPRKSIGYSVDENGNVRLDPGVSPGYLVRDTHLMFVKMLRSLLQPYDVTPSQWFFLRTLWIEEGLSQRELSRRVGMTEPTTVSALRLMERNGLVERRRNATDRRAWNIYLTAKSRRMQNKLLPIVVKANLTAAEGVSAAELATFRTVIGKMKGNLAQAMKEAQT